MKMQTAPEEVVWGYAPAIAPIDIPTTGRRANALARHFGHASLQDMADSLPDRAVVLDVGAGVSPLGREAALLRPDIEWVNIDACYDMSRVREKAGRDAPPNLHLLAADITDAAAINPFIGRADRVYSFWLMPHLSLESTGPARLAARHMLRMLKPDGIGAVGPVADMKYSYVSPGVIFKGSVPIAHTGNETESIETLVEKTRLRGFPRHIQRFIDRYHISSGVSIAGGISK